jgi:sugar/nucleoside kinase (ribokinase family)
VFLVLGTTTVDVFLSGTDRLPIPGDDEFTREGRAFLADPVALALGGNGANSAFALAALGERAALGSAVGRDMLGELATRWLDERGVDLEWLVRDDGGGTACTVVATDRSHRRIALHHAGCTAGYAPEAVPPEAISRASTLLLTGYHLLPRFRFGGAADLLAQARRSGATTALDLGPLIDPVADLEEISDLLGNLDFVIGNADELVACTVTHSPEEASETLLSGGARAVVVKRGRLGSELHAAETAVRAPGYAVEARGTVGAGDAFNAGFLAAVGRGRPAGEALRYGNAVAALVVESPNGILASPEASAVASFVARF